jgi:hypothetical protein
LASRIARKKNGEAVGKPILFFSLYFTDAKGYRKAVGVALRSWFAKHFINDFSSIKDVIPSTDTATTGFGVAEGIVLDLSSNIYWDYLYISHAPLGPY